MAGETWPQQVPVTQYSTATGYHHQYLDLFFRQPSGQPWHPDAVSKRFTQYAQEAGLPPCSIHDGRHASASYTIAAGGTIKDVKEQLGLSTLDIADKVYATLLREHEQHLAEKTAALIPRQSCRPSPKRCAARPRRNRKNRRAAPQRKKHAHRL
ncbi:tyrosine-type recombinase/integrase [Allorhizocola rhizosphaerae]|uniref:tyrosine-type recombinase/integrase n=1 Tax=Allorhizocola rhizosphaerae TaxID=1872709 RepID=UPI000E3B596F|nr:tyrosine-type recombinase/integrase [Allorhizocola rhizosphaerae]